jgi:hypothetical protein
MSSPQAAALSVEERQYYLATAMMTTALEYGRDDSESWWSAFLVPFVSHVCAVLSLSTDLAWQTAWLDAAYHALVCSHRLNLSSSKLNSIETSIANFIVRASPLDQRRWASLKQAVDRLLMKNIDEGGFWR